MAPRVYRVNGAWSTRYFETLLEAKRVAIVEAKRLQHDVPITDHTGAVVLTASIDPFPHFKA